MKPLEMLIPKWYKEKYKDRILNRKHASGYWFNFILPRKITIGKVRLYRWLNFYHRFKDKEK